MPRVARQPTKFLVSSQVAAAEFFGVSRTTFAGWLRLGCPGKQANGAIDLAAAAPWLARFKQPPATPQQPTSDDADLIGPATPALEKYRLARAAMAELELAERRGQLVPADDIEQALMAGMAAIRRAGDMLARQFGNTAVDVLTEALTAAEAASTKYFESLARAKD